MTALTCISIAITMHHGDQLGGPRDINTLFMEQR